MEYDDALRQASLDLLGILDTPPTERFDRITRLAKFALNAEFVSINLIDRDRSWSKSRGGEGVRQTTRDDSFCTVTIQQDEILEIPDTHLDERFRLNRSVVGAPKLRFYAGHPVKGPGDVNVGTLCIAGTIPRELTLAERAMLRDLALWVQDELDQTRETERAVRVQRGWLPQPLVTFPGYDVAGDFAAVHGVGGDFYDWYPVAHGASFTLADVMGKGVAAALTAATVRAVMRSASRSGGVAVAVEAAAEALDADLEAAETFVTLFHAHLIERTGELRYVDAGHGLTLIVRADGTSERLASLDLPVGAGWEATWQENTVTLRPGDTLVSVSDGVLDGFDGTLAALAEVDAIVRDAPNAQLAVECIIAAVAARAPDDVTVVVVRRSPACVDD